ncbi:hypothetical protein [Nakamurella lactea]|uniref:hypothetical protein n=1 Tax=Nakamurella lactea TaxID=459515 RepID=UPI0003F9872B|nr:hypothetical protein [Nakamurella lactea]
MPDPELIARIAATTGLASAEAGRVIDDVLAYYAESVDAFVRRRHSELQLAGIRNAQAFAQIAGELKTRVVGAPNLSERQLRRIVYS